MDVSIQNLEFLQFIEKEENKRKRKRNKKTDLEDFDDIDFKCRYRLTKNTVSELLPLIEENIKHNSHLNQALTPLEQLLVALRFYATGTHQLVVGDLIKVSQPTVSRVLNRVSKAIASLRPDFIKMPETEEECKMVSEDFFHIAQFPGAIGAVDCTHIPILSPGGNDAERFRNRKTKFSINTQTCVSADLLIRDVVARWPGSAHDSTIFLNSRLSEAMQTAPLKKYHLLGDSGYACQSFLLTPLSQPTTPAERRYNTAHILSRNTVERSYGVLKRRFPCLQATLRCAVESVPAVIVACCVLHNLSVTLSDPEPPVDPEVQDYIQEFIESGNGRQAGNRSATQPVPLDTAAGFAKRRLIIQRDPEPPVDPEVQDYIQEFIDESGNSRQAGNRNATQPVPLDTAAGFANRRLLIQRFF